MELNEIRNQESIIADRLIQIAKNLDMTSLQHVHELTCVMDKIVNIMTTITNNNNNNN